MARIWVGVLHVSPRVAQKIIERHGIEPDEVRQAVVCVAGLRFAWDEDPERGRRALVKTSIRRWECLVVLYPASVRDLDDEWNLGSAYFTNEG